MSFNDLSKIDAPTTVKADRKSEVDPKAKSTGKTPVEGSPAPKKS